MPNVCTQEKRWKFLETWCFCPYRSVCLLQKGISVNAMTIPVLISTQCAVLKDKAMTWDWELSAGARGPVLLTVFPAVTCAATWPELMWQRGMTTVATGKFTRALAETNCEQKLHISGYLKLSSEDFLVCSEVSSCFLFLTTSAGLHLQRQNQSHIATKHTTVFCLVLLTSRGPGLSTAGACDRGDNIN